MAIVQVSSPQQKTAPTTPRGGFEPSTLSVHEAHADALSAVDRFLRAEVKGGWEVLASEERERWVVMDGRMNGKCVVQVERKVLEKRRRRS